MKKLIVFSLVILSFGLAAQRMVVSEFFTNTG